MGRKASDIVQSTISALKSEETRKGKATKMGPYPMANDPPSIAGEDRGSIRGRRPKVNKSALSRIKRKKKD